ASSYPITAPRPGGPKENGRNPGSVRRVLTPPEVLSAGDYSSAMSQIKACARLDLSPSAARIAIVHRTPSETLIADVTYPLIPDAISPRMTGSPAGGPFQPPNAGTGTASITGVSRRTSISCEFTS